MPKETKAQSFPSLPLAYLMSPNAVGVFRGKPISAMTPENQQKKLREIIEAALELISEDDFSDSEFDDKSGLSK
jgi:hypothetical protein